MQTLLSDTFINWRILIGNLQYQFKTYLEIKIDP